MRRITGIVVILLLSVAAVRAERAGAQSVLDRGPNVAGGWLGAPASLHFNFLHRFNHSGPPQRQVINRPTFLLAYRFQAPLLVAAQYATRSDVADRYPNEWELFGRYGVLQEDAGGALDLSAQLGYNLAAESVDGEVSAARRLGPVRVLGAVRAFSSGYGAGEARWAVGGGASLRLVQWLAVAGDVLALMDALPGEETVWGAALQIALPLTPHTLSLQATNTNSSTLQGSSRGGKDVRWGFEFTIPVALARYFGERAVPVAVAPPPPPPDVDSMRVALADSISSSVWADVQSRLRADSAAAARAAAAQRAYADSVRAVARADSIRAAAVADSVRRAQAAQAAQAQRAPVIFRAGMRNLAFTPPVIEITAGTTVIWQNNDQVEHTVTATDRRWDSGPIRPGRSWQRTFDRPGTYEFYCTPHPFMKGRVIVRARP